MKARRIKFFDGSRIYIVIDEMSDLMLTSKKANYYITRIAQIARAANVMLITATQLPMRSVIPTTIQGNIRVRIGLPLTDKVALRVVDIEGCESLKIGQAILKKDNILTPFEFPYIPEENLNAIIDYRAK